MSIARGVPKMRETERQRDKETKRETDRDREHIGLSRNRNNIFLV